jgi:hypothetical protein
VELAVRDWARRDGDVAGRLRRADNRRMEFVRFCRRRPRRWVHVFRPQYHCPFRLTKTSFPKRAVVLVSGDQPPAAPAIPPHVTSSVAAGVIVTPFVPGRALPYRPDRALLSFPARRSLPAPGIPLA